MTERISVAQVAMDPRSVGSDALYSYRAWADLKVGEAVIVPLGNRPVLGFVTEISEMSEEDLGFPIAKMKEPVSRVQGLRIPPSVIDLGRTLAEEYLCSLPTALMPAIPPGIRELLQTGWQRTSKPVEKPLNDLQKECLRSIEEADGMLVESKKKPLSPGLVNALKALKKEGLVHQVMTLPKRDVRRSQAVYALTRDADQVAEFFKKEAKKKPAQALVILTLQEMEERALSSTEIRAMTGVTESTIKALATSSLIEAVDNEGVNLSRIPNLNSHQALAVDTLSEAIRQQSAGEYLLYGVTGSGKTEVFLRAATEALAMGRQVLYLVPEIALATQAVARLRERFGKGVALVHSELSVGERLENYLRVLNGEAGVVLGARSAAFAPFSNLGLIVMDEEHEASYKQETAPRYHTSVLARSLAQFHQCPVVFGSATPSLESYQAAEKEELVLLGLPNRAVAKATLPEVWIEDLGAGFREKRPALLSPRLVEEIQSTLERNEQVILFLNRRAFAPTLLCRECGESLFCPRCAVTLSFHRRENRLKCHHCDYRLDTPELCPKCGGSKLKPLGVGTEQVEAAIGELFPDAKVARLDRDVARKKGAMEAILASFGSGETQILVGTQMVAKGLDFPNVTLVGVVAADISLNIPDFRATERTFQLLCQVAGRAGRASKPGRVIIQTFNPEHPALTLASQHDYVGFFEAIRSEREELDYPPFSRLVNILLTNEEREDVIRESVLVRDRLSQLAPGEVRIVGPADCPLERLNNRWRRHLIVKLPPRQSPIWIRDCLDGVKLSSQMTIDVDAMNLS